MSSLAPTLLFLPSSLSVLSKEHQSCQRNILLFFYRSPLPSVHVCVFVLGYWFGSGYRDYGRSVIRVLSCTHVCRVGLQSWSLAPYERAWWGDDSLAQIWFLRSFLNFYLVRLAENRNGPGILRAIIYFCFAALIVFAASLYKVSS